MVFIQSNTSKMVYQSEMISYNQLTVTEVDDVIDVPSGFILEQNYPNPFNPNTKIRYTVASNVTGQMSKVVLKVYNLLGNEVATLVDEFKSAGSYEVEFQSAVNSQQLASGVYFYKLQAGSFVETRKMVFMK
ncbi:MAG: T9SS type A sorting domain-containing protein [Ignavibacteriales bacterium]|nr:MAG: T9SS type A sorting domain-containing protein [Ignavibacteriales bacterium]